MRRPRSGAERVREHRRRKAIAEARSAAAYLDAIARFDRNSLEGSR